MHHIAIVHDILLALCAKPARSARTCLSLALKEIVKSDHLGPDKAAFKIIMNNSCGLWSFPCTLNGPGADLFNASREITYQSKCMVP
jgi:hypothetical protein